jgi:Holliday junction resolvase-like predicted endonuclease
VGGVSGVSLHRRAAKRDSVEREIIDALEACGWTVQQVSAKDWFDLVAAKGTRTVFIEVKSGRSRLKLGQQRSFDTWPGEKHVFRSMGEVLAWEKEQRG